MKTQRPPQKASSPDSAAKTALTPKLRFPEFRDAEGWKNKPIGDEVDLLSGYPFDGSDISQDSTGARLLRGINITEGYVRHSLEIDRYFLKPADELQKFRVQSTDLVIAMDGSKVGKNSALITDEDSGALLVQRVARLRSNNAVTILFIFQRINSPTFHSYVDRINTSSGIPHISAKQIREFTIGFPSPAEQQKIAECLTTLDEAIAAQSQKLDALKTHKKGLMQQLFPREGETIPRLRFPEFQSAPEWEEKKLDQLVDFQSGGTPSKANPAFWNGSVPWVSAKDMKQLFLEDAQDHISTAAVDDGAKLVPAGALLMLVRGMTLLRDIPICVLRREMSFNQDVKALRPKDDVESLFLALLLTGNKDRLLEMVTIAGHGTGKLDTDELKALALMLPHPAEQQRIATCLTSLDDLITAQSAKLSALKTHKKGLMQQLFPSPEEPI